jgi:hypothetical protein
MDYDFLIFLVTLIGGILGIFAFFWKLFSEIKDDNAQTRGMVAEMRSDIKNTKEYHNCEFDRLHVEVEDLKDKATELETRIVKLESKR